MEEKNTNVSQTEENPEQNSPEISAESESMTEAAKDGVKTAVPKWLIVIIVAMAAVIIGLSVTLAVILAGGKTVDESSSSQSGTSADNSENSSLSQSTQSDISTDSSQGTVTEDGIILQYSVDNSWGDDGNMNYGVQFGITNNTNSGISGWELVVEIDGLKGCEGWNGTYSQNGNTVTVTNAEYNGDIQPGSTVVIGCNLNTDKELKISRAELNKTQCVVKAGNVNQNNQNNQNNQMQTVTALPKQMLTHCLKGARTANRVTTGFIRTETKSLIKTVSRCGLQV